MADHLFTAVKIAIFFLALAAAFFIMGAENGGFGGIIYGFFFLTGIAAALVALVMSTLEVLNDKRRGAIGKLLWLLIIWLAAGIVGVVLYVAYTRIIEKRMWDISKEIEKGDS